MGSTTSDPFRIADNITRLSDTLSRAVNFSKAPVENTALYRDRRQDDADPPGFKGLLPSVSRQFARKSPESEPPANQKPPKHHKGWKKTTIDVSGEDGKTYKACVHHFPAIGPTTGVIAFATGCKSSPTLFPEVTNQWREQGRAVVGIETADIDKFPSAVKSNTAINNWFFSDENSPFLDFYPAEMRRAIVTESVNSPYTIKTLLNPDVTDNLLTKASLKHLAHTVPFWGTSNSEITGKHEEASQATKLMREFVSRAYDGYVFYFCLDKRLGEGPLDRVYLAYEGAKSFLRGNGFNYEIPVRSPYHPEAVIHRLETRALLEIVEDLPPDHPIFSISQSFHISTDDPASSKRRGKYAAKLLRAPIHSTRALHDARPALMGDVTDAINKDFEL